MAGEEHVVALPPTLPVALRSSSPSPAMLAMRLSGEEDVMAAPRPHAADCTTTVLTAMELLPATPPPLPSTEKVTAYVPATDVSRPQGARPWG